MSPHARDARRPAGGSSTPAGHRAASGRRLPVALVAAALAAAALIAVTEWQARLAPPAPPAPVARLPGAPLAGAAASAPVAFAPSLAGTVPDGPRPAAEDVLALDPSLVRLFDYYLSATGERTPAEIRAATEREIDRRFGPMSAARAKDVFHRYLAFKQALSTQAPELARGRRSVDVLRARFATMRRLRAGFFGDDEARALFGPDDAEASDALARMAIEQDPALDAGQRRARLAALDAALPADVRAARAAPLLVTRLDEAAQRIRASGGSEDDVYRMRAAAVSPEAANRLADLDRDEAAWHARIADYLAQRDAALAAAANDADREAAVTALRNRLFTPDEQRRLPAYEG
jgi:lipase chaperone LimK